MMHTGIVSARIIVFTRYPEPGRTKTRLIPLLGAKGAATLQGKLTEQVVSVVKRFSRSCNVSMEIRYNGGCVDLMSQWLGDDLLYRRQTGVGLGAKMYQAFQDAFEEGCARVVVIGADILGISESILGGALDCLAEHDLVLGPANDGGYYLLGLRAPQPELFREISWGSGEVLRETVELAREFGLSLGFVKALDDVDRPDDIHKFNLY
ncbi:MAG: TIGR04282 family arsenosugar biosynthesis glycosyltransferase [Desulfomonilaceae bacterium]